VTLQTIYWLCLFLMLVGGAWAYRSKPSEGGVALVLWIALLVIGWAVFGAPIK
jgi:hypothetical protein